MAHTARRTTFAILSALLLAALLQFTGIAVAPSAQADGGGGIGAGTGETGGGGSGGCRTNCGGGGGGGGGGNTGGGGGGGGSAGPGGDGSYYDYYNTPRTYWFPKQPPGRIPTGGGWNAGTVYASYGGKCSGDSGYGPYLGVRVDQAGYYMNHGVNGAGKRQTLSRYTCIDPPHYFDSQYLCAYSVGAIASGPAKNPTVTSKNVTLGYRLTPFGSGNRTLATCSAGYKQRFSYGPKEYGLYNLRAAGRQIACTYRTYTTANARTGVKPKNEFVRCGGTSPYPKTDVAAWQLFCPNPGYRMDHRSMGYSYTPQDCLTPGGSGPWRCGPQVNQAPTYAGRPATTVQVINDAKNRDAVWNTIRPTGLRNFSQKKVRLGLSSGSTPNRAGASTSTQPWISDPGLNTWLSGWKAGATADGKTSWNLRFVTPGVPTKPFKVTPKWSFRAQFPVKVVVITGVNWKTGAVSTRITTKWTTMDATCTGQPASIEVLRARISN